VIALLDGGLQRALDEGRRVGEDRGAGGAGPERLARDGLAFDSLMRAWACESALTPTATSGGSNDACVTQFTVAAATRSPLAAVSTYRP
jgi:hypothetical protein